MRRRFSERRARKIRHQSHEMIRFSADLLAVYIRHDARTKRDPSSQMLERRILRLDQLSRLERVRNLQHKLLTRRISQQEILIALARQHTRRRANSKQPLGDACRRFDVESRRVTQQLHWYSAKLMEKPL